MAFGCIPPPKNLCEGELATLKFPLGVSEWVNTHQSIILTLKLLTFEVNSTDYFNTAAPVNGWDILSSK